MQVRFGGQFFIPAQALRPGDVEKINQIPQTETVFEAGVQLLSVAPKGFEPEVARRLTDAKIPYFYTPKTLGPDKSIRDQNPIAMGKDTPFLSPYDPNASLG